MPFALFHEHGDLIVGHLLCGKILSSNSQFQSQPDVNPLAYLLMKVPRRPNRLHIRSHSDPDKRIEIERKQQPAHDDEPPEVPSDPALPRAFRDHRGVRPFFCVGLPEVGPLSAGEDGLVPCAVPGDADVFGEEEFEDVGYLVCEEDYGGVCGGVRVYIFI